MASIRSLSPPSIPPTSGVFSRLKNALFNTPETTSSRSAVSYSTPSIRSVASSKIEDDRVGGWRVMVAFWLFGLINNILYVIILSSALDLVGTSVPKAIVLFADVFPSFLIKLVAPYFIHRIQYRHRVMVFAALSFAGMLLVAMGPASNSSSAIAIKLCGVLLASLSSGGGELSFLGLSHYYSSQGLSMWFSGTGGAGVFGAGSYVLSTVVFGLSPRSTLLAFAMLPIVMLVSFFVILPLEPLEAEGVSGYAPLLHNSGDDHDDGDGDDALDDGMDNVGGLLESSDIATNRQQNSMGAKLAKARSLFIPYMLPLLLVYIAEYTINQGVAPTLLFPIRDTPFSSYREFYPTYNAIYQMGVFISRSSRPFYQVHTLYTPALLQVANLVLLILHAMGNFIPSVWILFIIIFWEGLLGGLVYVTTFAEISENVPVQDREFSLSATSVSDSGGILISSVISMVLEGSLCDYQLARGRPYCRME